MQPVNKVMEGRPHIVDMIKNREISLIVNTVEEDRRSIQDSWSIRNSALQNRITYYTTHRGRARRLRRHAAPGGAARLRHPVPPREHCHCMSKIPITLAGAELLRAELHKLKTVERPTVITAIAEARAQGDISENAEYEAARERQGFIEGRIIELEAKLANAQIIDPALLDDDGRVVFGSTVELMDTGGNGDRDLPDRRRGRGRPQAREDLLLVARSRRPSSGSTRATSPRSGRRVG